MVKFREYHFADMAVSVVTWTRMAAKLWINLLHTSSVISISGNICRETKSFHTFSLPRAKIKKRNIKEIFHLSKLLLTVNLKSSLPLNNSLKEFHQEKEERERKNARKQASKKKNNN